MEQDYEKQIGRATAWQSIVATMAMQVKNNIQIYLGKSFPAASQESKQREWARWTTNPNVWARTGYDIRSQQALWDLMSKHTRAVKTDVVQFLDRKPVVREGERRKRHYTAEDLVAYMKRQGITSDHTYKTKDVQQLEQLDADWTDLFKD